MNNSTEICSRCKKEFIYNKTQDVANNELTTITIRSVVTDAQGTMVPFYAIPKDKQRLVNSKYISFICNNCIR